MPVMVRRVAVREFRVMRCSNGGCVAST